MIRRMWAIIRSYFEKQICPNCETGENSLLLDPTSTFCPHICAWSNNRCPYYIPIKKEKYKIFLRNPLTGFDL